MKIIWKTQYGYTLVELMVGIVLGLLLTAAVVQTYTASKQTYEVTQGISRVQENARFSMHFISKEIRSAGFSSCIGRVRNKLNGDPTEYISFASPVIGWTYNGTESGDSPFELSGNSLELPTNKNLWRGGASTNDQLPDFLSGRVVKGSDVLWVKNFEELNIIIKNHNDNSTPIVTESEHNIENDSVLLVGNCSEVELFQHLSQGNGNQVSLEANTGTGGDPGNRAAGPDPKWARVYTPEDNIYGFIQTFYYIGRGASGLPSLFRFTTSKPQHLITAADVASNSEEMVEGVESLQLLFGEDMTNDGTPNKYVSSNQVVNWDNIASTRVGLLIRSISNSISEEDQAANYRLLDSIELTHPQDDRIIRYAINSTVKPRNRGLDRNLAYYICDAFDEKKNEPQNGYDTCT